jgi:hypothetical protein
MGKSWRWEKGPKKSGPRKNHDPEKIMVYGFKN